MLGKGGGGILVSLHEFLSPIACVGMVLFPQVRDFFLCLLLCSLHVFLFPWTIFFVFSSYHFFKCPSLRRPLSWRTYHASNLLFLKPFFIIRSKSLDSCRLLLQQRKNSWHCQRESITKHSLDKKEVSEMPKRSQPQESKYVWFRWSDMLDWQKCCNFFWFVWKISAVHKW